MEAQEQKQETKLVLVTLAALTRVEHTEVIEVPSDISEEELEALVEHRDDQVDGGDYRDDPCYWESAPSTGYQIVSDMTPDLFYIRLPDGDFELDQPKDGVVAGSALLSTSEPVLPASDRRKFDLILNLFDARGVVVGNRSVVLTADQISDIIDHAAQLVVMKQNHCSGADISQVHSELAEALSVAGVI